MLGFCNHDGERDITTKWIKVQSKQNSQPLIMEIIATCALCGGEISRSYPSREQVEEHFRNQAKADGDTSRCWCFCNLEPVEGCPCPCHGGYGCKKKDAETAAVK